MEALHTLINIGLTGCGGVAYTDNTGSARGKRLRTRSVHTADGALCEVYKPSHRDEPLSLQGTQHCALLTQISGLCTVSRYQLQTALGEAPRLHSGWWSRRRWVGGVLGAGVEGSGWVGGMLVTPVSQSDTPVSHFNYACISVFICNELHSLEREREREGSAQAHTSIQNFVNTLRHVIIAFIIIIINKQGLVAEEDSSTERIYL